MKILAKYILKRLFFSLITVAPVIIMIVWLTVSIRYINLIITDDIDFTMFCKFIFCALPDITSAILPICFVISSIYVYHKMQRDKEITVMMTSGNSRFSIAVPLIFFSTLVSTSIFYLQAKLTPASYNHLTSITQQIQNKVSMSIIKPCVFNSIGSSIIYVGSKTDKSLNDVFISYIPNNKKDSTNIITAKSGSYKIYGKQLFITLKNGVRQVFDENHRAISTLKFDTFSYDVSEFINRYSGKVKKPHEKTQTELLNEANKTMDNKHRIRCLSEVYSRYSMSAIPIVNALLIAFFLIRAGNRVRHIGNVARCFTYSILFQTAITVITNASKKTEIFMHYSYILIIITIFILSYISFGKKIL